MLTVEHEDGVATVWLASQSRSNALGAWFWERMRPTFAKLATDPEVRAVVIAALGPHFTTGLDLAWVAEWSKPENTSAGRLQNYHEIKGLQDAISCIAECPKPTIAAVHGNCLGGGMDIITACDIRMCAADAVFSVRETRIAIVADVGTLQRLPHVIAPGHAHELIFSGKDIGAERAQAIGLVNDVFETAEETVASAQALAAEIAANSPLSVQGSKAVMRAREGSETQKSLDYVALWNAAFLQSEDFMEAMVARMEKREPKFTGR